MNRLRLVGLRVARAVPPVRRALDDRQALRAELRALRAEQRALRSKLRRRSERVRKLRARLELTQSRLAWARKVATSNSRGVQRLKSELAIYRESPPLTGEETYDYVFVIAFQRSGSTLLQAILNSIPGYLIRGENDGLVSHLYHFHRKAQEQRRIRADWANEPGFPFFGINDYPDEVALAAIRGLLTSTLLRPLPGTTTLGFKEVDWWVEDLDDYLAFFREVFPGARFIANTRRIEDSAKSRWWATRDDSVEVLTDQQEKILAATSLLGDDAFHLRYDDYVNDHDQLKPLFDWLGAPFDRATIDQVMSKRYA